MKLLAVLFESKSTFSVHVKNRATKTFLGTSKTLGKMYIGYALPP